MDATAILDKLGSLGISVRVTDDRLQLEPRSKVPDDLVEELRRHKQDVVAHLKLRGYRQKYSDPEVTAQELEEIAQRVYTEGYVLLWSKELSDLVAFYRDEEAKSEIPPGFVPYSVKELEELFGDNPVSEHELRLLHEAKKHGGRVINHEEK